MDDFTGVSLHDVLTWLTACQLMGNDFRNGNVYSSRLYSRQWPSWHQNKLKMTHYDAADTASRLLERVSSKRVYYIQFSKFV